MHLEKIKIAGFKSFANKTALDFDQGISAIVGPNGSGKSNIADAIRWVLGEQSMKTLRGKKSDDVIFAGTSAKGRMGVAQVTLVLNNEDKKLPLDYKSIEITRRVYRDGDAEYLINKNKVRLLDVHELLARAGFSQRAYGVIGQGMIESLLKASPKELREMFYDACGVRAFHIKKHSAEQKLQRTRNNYERGNELLLEIEPRLKSLERQAKRFQKKEALVKEKAEIIDIYFAHTYQWAVQKEDAIASELKQMLEVEKEVEDEIASLEKQLEMLENAQLLEKRKKIEQRVDALREELNAISRNILVLEGKIEIENERKDSSHLKEMRRQVEDLEKQKASLEELEKQKNEKKVELEKGIARNEQEKNKLEQSLGEAVQKIKDVQKEMHAKGITLVEVEKELSAQLRKVQSSIALLGDTKKINEAKKVFSESSVALKKLLARVEKANGGKVFTRKIDTLSQQKRALEKELFHILEAAQKMQVSFAVLSNEKKSITLEIKKNAQQLALLHKRIKNEKERKVDESVIKKIEVEKAAFENKKKSLEEALLKEQNKLSEVQKEEQEERSRFIQAEKQFRSKNGELNKQKDAIRSLEIKEAEARNETRRIYEELIVEKGQGLETYLEVIGKKQLSLEEKEIRKIGARLQVLNTKISNIGEIDDELIKEYTETKTRFDFLTSQRDDLKNAEKKLRAIIRELDEKIETQFNQSFEAIASLFQKYFKVLFNGGVAKLSKRNVVEESEDEEQKKKEMLIEIKANPPGKKLQSLAMLSGGERALTSIALLMAIIESNPPPFIVLDEVDAALDEANSRRFAKILIAAAKRSQVLAITHNRATMSEASILYGVTMQESGISKVLSVKLEEAQKMRAKKQQTKKLVVRSPFAKQVV